MARDAQLSRAIRRRRAVAVAAFLLALAVAAGVTVSALRRHPTPAPVVAPPPKPFRIVFPEGFTRAQMGVRVHDVALIADHERHLSVRLNRPAYLAASQRAVVACFGKQQQRNLEGFLFPATYDFVRTTTSRQLVRDQLQTFCRTWRRVDLSYARSRHLTAYDVLTIASMVEREAEVPSERPLIAAVIYNRLRDHMQLGIDATLRYGLDIPPTQSITESELQSDNPYNTRKLFGLPPTPIANPGLASIRAAAHPADVDYLYFVRKPDHRHHFFTASVTAFDQYLATHGYG